MYNRFDWQSLIAATVWQSICPYNLYVRRNNNAALERTLQKELSKTTNDFNSSISFDSRMYKEDIEGSIAHATMLGRCGIIKEEEANDIVKGLKGILADIENGTLHIDMEAEDIHTFIEGELTKRIGDNGKRLHTSRSRNDQVAVDIKLYLKKRLSM